MKFVSVKIFYPLEVWHRFYLHVLSIVGGIESINGFQATHQKELYIESHLCLSWLVVLLTWLDYHICLDWVHM